MFFDFVYPIWDAVLLAVVILVLSLSYKFMGGILKIPVLIIMLGFIANYFADMGLSYLSTINEYYNGGLPDLLFAIAMCLLSLGVNMLEVPSKS
jgi:hypothetical protein